MTREVICYVNNQSGYDLTYNTDCYQKGESGSSHGKFTLDPEKTLQTGATTEAFALEKSGLTYGVTGWVSYSLGNGQGQVVFMFNNPYSYDGDGYNGNCWFYAVIQGIGNQAVGVPINVHTSVSGFNFNLNNPTEDETMNVTVTISNS